MTYEEIKEMNIVEPYCFETNREEEWYDVGLMNGADIGYKQGIKDTIEKACIWWEEEFFYPTMTETEIGWYKEKIAEFRKAMEE